MHKHSSFCIKILVMTCWRETEEMDLFAESDDCQNSPVQDHVKANAGEGL